LKKRLRDFLCYNKTNNAHMSERPPETNIQNPAEYTQSLTAEELAEQDLDVIPSEATEAQRGKLREAWSKVGELAKSSTASAVASFAASAALRMGLRGTLVAAYGSSLGVNIAVGAGTGAVVEGAKSYFKERKAFQYSDIATKLESIANFAGDAEDATPVQVTQRRLKQAATIARAKEILQKQRTHNDEKQDIGQEEREVLAGKLQAAIAALEAQTETNEQETPSAQLANVLKIAKGARKEVKLLDRYRAGKLIAKESEAFISERTSVRKKEIVVAALRGAAVGAVGGAIGGAIGAKVADWWHGGVNQELAAGISGGASGVKEVAKAAISPEQKALAVEAVRQRFTQELLEHKFSAAIGLKGLTGAARESLHDYLVNASTNGTAANYSLEQLVIAEDYLAKHPEQFAQGWTGEQLQHALDYAQQQVKVSPELSHMLHTPGSGHYLSEATQQKMFSLGSAIHPENDIRGRFDAIAEQVIPSNSLENVPAVVPVDGEGSLGGPLNIPQEQQPQPSEKTSNSWWKYAAGVVAAATAGVGIAKGASVLRAKLEARRNRTSEHDTQTNEPESDDEAEESDEVETSEIPEEIESDEEDAIELSIESLIWDDFETFVKTSSLSETEKTDLLEKYYSILQSKNTLLQQGVTVKIDNPEFFCTNTKDLKELVSVLSSMLKLVVKDVEESPQLFNSIKSAKIKFLDTERVGFKDKDLIINPMSSQTSQLQLWDEFKTQLTSVITPSEAAERKSARELIDLGVAYADFEKIVDTLSPAGITFMLERPALLGLSRQATESPIKVMEKIKALAVLMQADPELVENSKGLKVKFLPTQELDSNPATKTITSPFNTDPEVLLEEIKRIVMSGEWQRANTLPPADYNPANFFDPNLETVEARREKTVKHEASVSFDSILGFESSDSGRFTLLEYSDGTYEVDIKNRWLTTAQNFDAFYSEVFECTNPRNGTMVVEDLAKVELRDGLYKLVKKGKLRVEPGAAALNPRQPGIERPATRNLEVGSQAPKDELSAESQRVVEQIQKDFGVSVQVKPELKSKIETRLAKNNQTIEQYLDQVADTIKSVTADNPYADRIKELNAIIDPDEFRATTIHQREFKIGVPLDKQMLKLILYKQILRSGRPSAKKAIKDVFVNYYKVLEKEWDGDTLVAEDGLLAKSKAANNESSVENGYSKKGFAAVLEMLIQAGAVQVVGSDNPVGRRILKFIPSSENN
jgi:hypothetical protein